MRMSGGMHGGLLAVQHIAAAARRWHDDSKGGTLEGGPRSKRCRPRSEAELGSEEVLAGGWFNAQAFPVMRGSRIEVFSAYNVTQPMWNFHLKDTDCEAPQNPRPVPAEHTSSFRCLSLSGLCLAEATCLA
jgi:hypothetical protein